MGGTRLIDEPNGENVKDWIISSQAPNLATHTYTYLYVKRYGKEYGEGSETR